MDKKEIHDKLRTQLERGIITPEDYAMKCVETLYLERREADGG